MTGSAESHQFGLHEPLPWVERCFWALLPAVACAVSLQVATQVLASELNTENRLGPEYGGWYPPWRMLTQTAPLWQTHPVAFTRASDSGLITQAVLTLIGLWARSLRKTDPRHRLHGSARWATPRDLKRAGLLPRRSTLSKILQRVQEHMGRTVAVTAPPAVYVGAFRDGNDNVHYLTHNGPEHVLAMAPTRSGKGVGLVLPTLLSWHESAFILDVKGELYALTAGWRHKYARNTVLRLEFAAPTGTVRWNPLAEVRVGTGYEVGDVQNLALMLVDPDGKGVEGDHWRSTAMALLVGLLMHLLPRTPEDDMPSLAAANAALSNARRPLTALWSEMANSPLPAVAAEGVKMMNRPIEEAGSVVSTAQRCLALYLDPVIASNTCESDFRIRDLMHSDQPVSLYLVTQPVDKDRLVPLIRLFTSMVIRLLADKIAFEGGRPVPAYKHPLLLMLDEFVSLKRLNILQESLAYIAGYGIKAYLVCQDRRQLTSQDYGYGPDETITANTHLLVAMRPGTVDTAEYLSKRIGQTTVPHTLVSHTGHGLLAKKTYSTQYTQRPLLTADECMNLPGAKTEGDKVVEGGDMLVFAAGMPAARGPQPLYFRDPVFSARARIAAPLHAHARAKRVP